MEQQPAYGRDSPSVVWVELSTLYYRVELIHQIQVVVMSSIPRQTGSYLINQYKEIKGPQIINEKY
jgi:hypothetical protein